MTSLCYISIRVHELKLVKAAGTEWQCTCTCREVTIIGISYRMYVRVVCGKPGSNHLLFLCGIKKPGSLCSTTQFLGAGAGSYGGSGSGEPSQHLGSGSEPHRSTVELGVQLDVMDVCGYNTAQSVPLPA